MSIVVGLRQNGKVYLGADTQYMLGDTIHTELSPANFKIWKTKGLENSITGHAGYVRTTGLVKTKSYIPEDIAKDGKINFDFVQGKMIFDIYNDLKENNLVSAKDNYSFLNSRFLFAYKDKLYELSNDMTVFEPVEYDAIGSSEYPAKKSFSMTKGEEPEIRVLKALATACKMTYFANYPLIVTDTESMEFKIYTKDDVKKLIENSKKT